jgi:hypothetical protein
VLLPMTAAGMTAHNRRRADAANHPVLQP